MAVSWSLTDSGSFANTTSAAIDIGAEAPDRIVVVVVMSEGSVTNPATGATINGVTATTVPGGYHSSFQCVKIYYANVPTGTTGVTFSTTGGNSGAVGIDVYRLVGAALVHVDTDFDPPTVSDVTTVTLDQVTVPDDGIGIYGAMNDTSSTAITWTNTDSGSAGETNYTATTINNVCSTAIVTTEGTPSVTATGANDDMAGCAIAFEAGVENFYNIAYADGGITMDALPVSGLIPKNRIIDTAAWMIAYADPTPAMQGTDAGFIYDSEIDEPDIPNTYDVEAVAVNIRVNSPPPGGFLSQANAINLAVWMIFYAAEGVPSGRGLKNGEGVKERPDLHIQLEAVAAIEAVANIRG